MRMPHPNADCHVRPPCRGGALHACQSWIRADSSERSAGGASTIVLTPFLNDIENMPFDEVHNKGLHLQSTSNIAYYEVGQTRTRKFLR